MIKGKKHSPESIEKIKKSLKGKEPWNKGKKGVQKAWNKGKPSPWTTKRNLETNHLMTGENAYHWKGGKTTRERKLLMARKPYKLWRISVMERDNWTCQNCQSRGIPLEAHHIKSWVEYPSLRYELDNGVALCLPCHNLTKKKN